VKIDMGSLAVDPLELGVDEAAHGERTGLRWKNFDKDPRFVWSTIFLAVSGFSLTSSLISSNFWTTASSSSFSKMLCIVFASPSIFSLSLTLLVLHSIFNHWNVKRFWRISQSFLRIFTIFL
jgi:hypothetical protein